MSYSVPPSLLNRSQSINGEGFVIIPQLKIHGSHLKDNEKTNQHSSIKRCCHIRISKLELTSDSRDKIPTSIKFSVGLNKIRRTLITTPIDLSKTLEEVVLSQSNSNVHLNNIQSIINPDSNNFIDDDNIEDNNNNNNNNSDNNDNNNNINNNSTSFIPISSSSIILPSSNNNVSLSPKRNQLVDNSNSHQTQQQSNTSSKKTYLYPLDIRFSFHYDHSLKEYDDFVKITLLKCTSSSSSSSSSSTSSSNKPRQRDSNSIPISYSTVNLSQILQQGEFVSDLDMIPIISNNSNSNNSNNGSINNNIGSGNDFINNGSLISQQNQQNQQQQQQQQSQTQAQQQQTNGFIPTSSLNISICSVPKEIEQIENAQEYQLNDIAISDEENLFFDSDSNDEDDEEVISYQDVPYHFDPIIKPSNDNNNDNNNNDNNNSGSPTLLSSSPSAIPHNQLIHRDQQDHNDQELEQPHHTHHNHNQQFIDTSETGLLSQKLLDIREYEHHNHSHHHHSHGHYRNNSGGENNSKKNKKSKLQKLSSLIKPITSNKSSSERSNRVNNNNNNNSSSGTITNNSSGYKHQQQQQQQQQEIIEDYDTSSESSSDVYEQPVNPNITNKSDYYYYQTYEEGDDEKDDIPEEFYNTPTINQQQQQPSSTTTTSQQTTTSHSPFKLSNEKAFTPTISNLNSNDKHYMHNSGGIGNKSLLHVISSPLHLSSSSVPSSSSAPININSSTPLIVNTTSSNNNLELILNQLATSDKAIHLFLINSLRRRGKKMEQIIEQSQLLKSNFKVVATKSNSEITMVFKSILSKLHNEQTKIVIAGSDSYVNAIMKAYVTLISLKPRGWNPFLFYLLPLGKSNDISLQLASNDITYSTLFSNNPEWKRIFDQIDPPTIEQTNEIENKVSQYVLSQKINASNQYKFPIGEALLTITSSATSTAVPFIKGIQINQISNKLTTIDDTNENQSLLNNNNFNEQDSNTNLQVQLDYWVPKKKGTDHIVFKSVLQSLKLTRLPIISNLTKLQLSPPNDNSFSILVVHKSLNKKKNMLTRLGGSVSGSINQNSNSNSNQNSSNQISGNISGSNSKQKKQDSNLVGGGSVNIDSHSKNTKEDKQSKEPSKENQKDNESISCSITKLMVGPVASNSSSSSSNSNSEIIYFKVLIDGVEFLNVKFLSISPQWSTHVKYFPIQSFVDNIHLISDNKSDQQDHHHKSSDDIYSE